MPARPPLDCLGCGGRGCAYCTDRPARRVELSPAFTQARTQARAARVSSTVTECVGCNDSPWLICKACEVAGRCERGRP